MKYGLGLLACLMASGCGQGVTYQPETPPGCTYLREESPTSFIYRCDAGAGVFSIAYLRPDGSVIRWCMDNVGGACR